MKKFFSIIGKNPFKTMKCPIDLNKRNKKTAKGRQMFSPGEDLQLRNLVNQYGTDWRKISENMPGRTARQCRERYKNYVAPGVENKPWTAEEDYMLQMMISQIGQKWAIIASQFKNRSEVNVKNRWSSLCKRFNGIPSIQQQQQMKEQTAVNSSNDCSSSSVSIPSNDAYQDLDPKNEVCSADNADYSREYSDFNLWE